METINIKPGRTFTREIMVYADAAHTAPYDLTGGTVTFTIDDRPGGEEVKIGTAQIDTDPTTGKVIASLGAADTVDWEDRVLYGSVVLDETNGNSSVIDEFKLIVDS
jgi:hypothetical protein